MAVCFIGVGSNLGSRRRNIQVAIGLLRKSKIKILKKSSLIETKPVGGPKQGKFLNGVLKIETNLTPFKLLKTLKAIEKKLGRIKAIQNAPRPIDLDILLYDDKTIKTSQLVIPHPRMFRRSFVLKPLKEITPIKIIRSIKELQKIIKSYKRKGKTIGFVPTMGAFHKGHLSLMRQAKKDCDICVVSIFVNPIQFGPKEDFKKYPRDLKKDETLSRLSEVDIIFYPSVNQMYPSEFKTFIEVKDLSNILCGKFRPGHFRGVATVVAKLFNIVMPDIAYFGQKDAQQAVIIQKMARDLNMPLKIKVMPIVREPGGLAMSSRNVYLNPQERKDAVVLYQALKKAKALIKNGECSVKKIVSAIKKEILDRNTVSKIDYVECVSSDDLSPLKIIKGKVLIALAAWFGRTRLIDNIIVKV